MKLKKKEIMRLFKLGRLQIVVMSLSILFLLFFYILAKNSPKPINLDYYEELFYSSKITSAKMINEEVIIYTKEGSFKIVKDAIDIKKLAREIPLEVDIKSNNNGLFLIFLSVLIIFIVLFFVSKIKNRSLVKKQNNSSENKNIAIATEPFLSSNITPTSSKIKFTDVAGIEEVKEELSEIVDFLKNPSKYKNLNITLPKGVLLVGPPGVGKTLIAKAVAGEAGVPFFYQSGALFVQIYVGMGAKRVRELFSVAKINAPSIIFIDEIDATGKARGNMRNDEREATLNQLLTEMDGFEDNTGVIVIAATNKIEMIDEALLRSGRFDRRIFISLPDMQDRIKIIDTYLKDKNHSTSAKDIAKITVGFSGAALCTLVNEAAINTLKRGAKKIAFSDFLAVRDKVLIGKKKLMHFSEQEKEIQAIYQAAKALCAYWFEVDFDKITLVGDFTKERDKEIESKTYLLSKIKVFLAGIAILKINFQETYSNSAEDLNKARNIAKEMVERYAMGKNLLPTHSDIEDILSNSLSEVTKFLEGMQKPINEMVLILIEEESLTKNRIKEIIGEIF